MQSSGFLDLKSLMALNQTCKANMIDELSLVLLIENEITRDHGVKTIEEAIAFWRRVYHRYPLLKEWLERDYSMCTAARSQSIITVARYLSCMSSDAACYEVMLTKMLRTVPTQTERLRLLSEQDTYGMTFLHSVAEWGSPESLKTVLAICPKSECLRIVSREYAHGWTILHGVTYSGNPESVRLLLTLYPEAERVSAVTMTDVRGWTVLHCAARSGNFESVQTILDLYPESERLQALNMKSHDGEAVLHLVADLNIEYIKAVLSLFPESERLQALNNYNEGERTPLAFMSEETRDSIMEWLSQQSESSSGQKRLQDSALQDEEVDVES